MTDPIEIPTEVSRNATHQNWERTIKDVSLTLNALANDVYQCWNHRQPPQQSLVFALRYLHLELDSAMHFLQREVQELKEKAKKP